VSEHLLSASAEDLLSSRNGPELFVLRAVVVIRPFKQRFAW
jgi:hypothetical protein